MADTSTRLATLIDGLGLTAAQIAGLNANLSTLQRNEMATLNAQLAAREDGLLVTRKGFDLLGKALAGQELCYTRVAFGDGIVNGEVVELTEAEMFELTDMVHFKQELPISNVRFSGGGTATITFLVRNDDLESGYFIREVAVFARDPDTNAEVLYCYRNGGVKINWIPAGNGTDVWRLEIDVTTAVGNAANVTAVISGGGGSLPIATTQSLGVVQIGYGLNITPEGVLSRAAGVILDSLPSSVEGAMWYTPASN